MPDVLAIIPARGGSKGLPRKNILDLHGHPLLAYSIAAGRRACGVTRTVCSTDDLDIQQHAQAYGAEVPFLRPSSLALDASPDLPLFLHVLEWFAEYQNWKPEIVVHLRPTSPIRFPGQVDEAIELLVTHADATSVRAVCLSPCTPYKMWCAGSQEGSKATQGRVLPTVNAVRSGRLNKPPRNPPDFRPFSRLFLTLAQSVGRGQKTHVSRTP